MAPRPDGGAFRILSPQEGDVYRVPMGPRGPHLIRAVDGAGTVAEVRVAVE